MNSKLYVLMAHGKELENKIEKYIITLCEKKSISVTTLWGVNKLSLHTLWEVFG